MRRLAVITSTRAEWGLLAPVVRELRAAEGPGFRCELVVTGTHLTPEFGTTIGEIRGGGFRVDVEVPVPVDSATAADTSRNQAAALAAFAGLLERERYDAALVLGDRYETVAAALAAANALVPLFHMCGGDVSEGAADDAFRHCVTKLSYLHFPTNAGAAARIVQMGEDPARVFCFGSTGIDNALALSGMPEADALASVGLPPGTRFALCTFHPVTLEAGGVEGQVSALVGAMSSFPDVDFVATKANADRGGALVNAMLGEAAGALPNLRLFPSLGARRYLSLARRALLVLGNSSSGIVETPALGTPTVNIGDRQRGRLRGGVVIDCAPERPAIEEAIREALARGRIPAEEALAASPYGDGRAARRIAAKCLEVLGSGIDLKKGFYEPRDGGAVALEAGDGAHE